MTQSFSFGNLEFNLGPGHASPPDRPEPETPFRILVLSDFSGRANRGIVSPITDRPLKVDCDNIDTVMAKLGVTLHLSTLAQDGGYLEISFGELEDFHPDSLYSRLELFQALRKTRKGLLDPATYDAAAAEVRGWAQPQPGGDGGSRGTGGSDKPPVEKPDTRGESSGGNTFEALLGKPNVLSQSKPGLQGAANIDALLQQVVGPHIVHTDPQQADLITAVDQATSKQMRSILHDPDFQALEAAWRGLDFLVRHLETDEQLQIYIVDISQAEVLDDLVSAEDLKTTRLYKVLVEQSVGSAGRDPWAVVVGDFTFDATVEDALVLGHLVKITAQAGAPFLAGAHPHLLGCESLAQTPDPTGWDHPIDPQAAEAWGALRRLPEASYLGLALPRYLMRLPYGGKTDEIDRFEFDEIDANPSKGPYLWGNPGYLCAYLLGQAFSQEGWNFTPGAGQDIEDLPAHMYKEDGESKMTPCAEAWLSDRTAEAILAKGLMPLLSIHGRDAVRLARFESIAEPAKNLTGRWG